MKRLAAAAATMAAVLLCVAGGAAGGPGAAAAGVVAAPAGSADAGLALRVMRLTADVELAEDLRDIEKLQRAYGYYVDKGLWEDAAALFTEDAVANYPAGIYVGRPSIREHLYRNVGGGRMGDLGLGDGRLYDHMNIQPVVHVDAGGRTAHGRWRALAMFGALGRGATWAEGVYEMQYRKEGGVWRISKLDYYPGFGASYKTGWAAPGAGAMPVSRRHLAHPPDRERTAYCAGFPKACIAPFHYGNPGTTDGSKAWTAPPDAELAAAAAALSPGDLRRRVADLQHRVALLADVQQIENLQRIYGYYIDRAMWDQAADLFADDATLESGQQGVYVGRRRVRAYLGTLGRHGLSYGWFFDHIQLQPIVDVAPDGRTARLRSRELDMTGHLGGQGLWTEGVYENSFIKQNGVWKFRSLHFYPTFITDYDKGWGEDAQPVPTVNPALPPDRPPTEVYAIYPKAHIPPFHYPNPVTGEPPHYPPAGRGGPDPKLARAALGSAPRPFTPPPPADVDAALAQAERGIRRVEDWYEIENLESAYGYYLDKSLWNDLADLFSADGSMELAQRGVYRGREHVRAFLLQVFGRGHEGPVAGRLGNHLQLQPVIDVAPDGQHARIRIRMLQQMSFGPRASIGAAVYENTAVMEDGRWKLEVDHTYNTLAASYQGGWTHGASRAVPGEDRALPPDAPPTTHFQMFPVVYDIPFHYANPVSGRTAVPPILDGSGAHAMPDDIARALRAIGPRIEGRKTAALYAPLHAGEIYRCVVQRDLSYGPYPRNKLDVFMPPERAARRPVLVFVPGGGFTGGSKHLPGSPFYDNIGVWAADHGLVGITIDYRLAPRWQWPSGIEDLSALVAFLKKHAAEYGGDPQKIFLWGHSAGGSHVADYVAHAALSHAQPQIAGAILMSAAVYDLGTTPSVWKSYYGEDVSSYARRSALPGLVRTTTPLLVVDAELDPPLMPPQTAELLEARRDAGRPVPYIHLAGHSHLSEAYAVGTTDESLTGPLLAFIRGGGRLPAGN
ncbi:MAG TPA: nuclear transport factor 2 family protein [Steroidobacteraceae bacterium]|nr:nuclear transport factor 2 family protein [Steroidobacteraceae bacterium]